MSGDCSTVIGGDARRDNERPIEDDSERSLPGFSGISFWRLIQACFDERSEVSAITRFFHFFEWNETERCGIDAVTKTGRPRAIIENMAEMGIGGLRANLGADHAMGGVVALDDFLIDERLAEAGPTTPGIELIQRTKERFAGNDVDVNAGFVIVPEFVSKGRLGVGVLGHLELRRGEFLFQFVSGRFLKVLHGRICGLDC